MKKFLKKLGVFGLIVAVLSPFASIPEVNADDDCKHYLNQYLFLDVTNGSQWGHYTESNGYDTYTTFLYNFVDAGEGQKIKIDNVFPYPLLNETDTSAVNEFATLYGSVINANNGKLERTDRFGSIRNYNSTFEYESDAYESIDVLLHGYWGYDGREYKKSNYDDIKPHLDADFDEETIQGILSDAISNGKLTNIDKEFEIFDVSFSGAYLNQTSKKFQYKSYSNLVNYFQLIVDNVEAGFSGTESEDMGYVVYNEEDKNYYLNIGINRETTKSKLNKLNFGYSAGSPSVSYVWSTINGNIKDSYDAIVNYSKHCVKDSDGNCTGVYANTVDPSQPSGDFCTGAATCYQVPGTYDVDSKPYYWPVVLNVEYSVCAAANIPDPGTGNQEKWTLKYDPNSTNNDYTNMPSNQSDITADKAVVSSTVPTRTDHTFDGWNTEKNGSGTSYKAGAEVKKPSGKNEVILYAQWKKTGTEDNKKQGVISYVLGFAAVGLVAGGIYLVSKRRNLFKQI